MKDSRYLVFVGGYAGAAEEGVRSFLFDEMTGALSPLVAFAGIHNPSFLVVHPNRRWLYAVSETGVESDGVAGGVWALRVGREPGSIEAINHQPSGGDGPCHLRLDATGKWLFVANYGSGSVGVLPIRDDGSLGEMSAHVQHRATTPNDSRQEGPHAHSTILTPDKRFAIVADLGLDELIVYRFDSERGTLTPHGSMAARRGAGPRHMAFHPGGGVFYVANELNSTVSVCKYDARSGTLVEIQTLPTIPPESATSYVGDIHYAHSTGRVYVSNRGHDSVAVYEAGGDGTLSLLTIAPCGGQWPRNFALAPDEKFLLVANQNSGDITVLPLMKGGPEIGSPVARAAVAKVSCLQFV